MRETNGAAPGDTAVPEVNFGAAADFSLGVEEELLLVDPETYELDEKAPEMLARVSVPDDEGEAMSEAYTAVVETASPICADAGEATAACAALRTRLIGAGATLIGAGLHPTAAFGDVTHYPSQRAQLLTQEMRGLLSRTPTCALHIHVGMPDARTAIRAFNALRGHLPLLQALAGNSPYWHGQDSGMASARAAVFRGFPRSEIPPAFVSFDEYVERASAVAAAGDMPDYTFLWWDVRLHPVLGTLEIRALDSQSSLRSVAGIVALVHGLAAWASEHLGAPAPRDVLMESSFRAARDGLEATLWHHGGLRPAVEIAHETIELARPYSRDLGSDDALEEVERMLVLGNGATRQTAAFTHGAFPAVLAHLVAESQDL